MSNTNASGNAARKNTNATGNVGAEQTNANGSAITDNANATGYGPNAGPYDPTNKVNSSTNTATGVAPNSGSDDPNPNHFEASDPNKAPNPQAHAGPTTTELMEVIKQQQDMINKQGKQMDVLQKTMTSATNIQANVKKVKPTIPKETVEFEGETYRWRAARFLVDGNWMTAEEAAFDNGALASILKIEGQGLLQKLL